MRLYSFSAQTEGKQVGTEDFPCKKSKSDLSTTYHSRMSVVLPSVLVAAPLLLLFAGVLAIPRTEDEAFVSSERWLAKRGGEMDKRTELVGKREFVGMRGKKQKWTNIIGKGKVNVEVSTVPSDAGFILCT